MSERERRDRERTREERVGAGCARDPLCALVRGAGGRERRIAGGEQSAGVHRQDRME